MNRFVIYSPSAGVYLGETILGVAIFSRWDPYDKTEAPTFANWKEWEKVKFGSTNECTIPNNVRLVQVFCHGEKENHATKGDLSNALLPVW